MLHIFFIDLQYPVKYSEQCDLCPYSIQDHWRPEPYILLLLKHFNIILKYIYIYIYEREENLFLKKIQFFRIDIPKVCCKGEDKICLKSTDMLPYRTNVICLYRYRQLLREMVKQTKSKLRHIWTNSCTPQHGYDLKYHKIYLNIIFLSHIFA
jgi:hypothetical protein